MAGLQTDKDIYAGLSEAKKDEYYTEQKGDPYEKSVLGTGSDDGLEYPTDEEFITLRSIPDHVPWGAYRTYFHSRLEGYRYSRRVY